jgi:hypothetical protein
MVPYVYVTGDTTSRDFPTTDNAAQRRYTGYGDAFVAGLDIDNAAMFCATYLGGSGSSGAHAIAVDASYNFYITGGTDSANFPTTPGAVQRRYGGGGDAFVAKLRWTASRCIVSATYLGGSSAEEGNGIAVDPHGHVYVTGDTKSTNFRTTANAAQTSYGGGSATGFVASLTMP